MCMRSFTLRTWFWCFYAGHMPRYRHWSLFPQCNQTNFADLGLVKISEDGQSYDIVWGFKTVDGQPRVSKSFDESHRTPKQPWTTCCFHCHPTNLIALTFTQDLDKRYLSRLYGKCRQSHLLSSLKESELIPYMTPGTEIGKATAEKMVDFSAVIRHIMDSLSQVSQLDETHGLVEVIEKQPVITASRSLQHCCKSPTKSWKNSQSLWSNT